MNAGDRATRQSKAVGAPGRSSGRDFAGPLPDLRFTTNEYPERLQFDAWRDRLSAWMDVSRPADQFGGFRAEQRTWQLGSLAVSLSSGDAIINLRDRARIRRDQLDHWLIVLPRRGQLEYDDGTNAIRVQDRKPLLCGLHVPSVTRRSKAEWILAFVARDALPTIAPSFDALIGRTLDTSLGGLLSGHLNELARQLPAMTAAEAPRAAEATLAMIRVAVTGSAEHCEVARPQLEAVQRSQVLVTVRAHLGSVRLNPAQLGRLVRMSRSQLYRLFEGDGGVARVIQRERLRTARRVLSDPVEKRKITDIAEALGMPDASSFSRTFRQEFGMSPSEFRAEALRVGCELPPSGVGQTELAHELSAVLRRLRG